MEERSQWCRKKGSHDRKEGAKKALFKPGSYRSRKKNGPDPKDRAQKKKTGGLKIHPHHQARVRKKKALVNEGMLVSGGGDRLKKKKKRFWQLKVVLQDEA